MRTSDLQSPNGKKKKMCKPTDSVGNCESLLRAYLSQCSPILRILMKLSSSTVWMADRAWSHCQKWLGPKIKAQVRWGNQSQRMSQGRKRRIPPRGGMPSTRAIELLWTQKYPYFSTQSMEENTHKAFSTKSIQSSKQTPPSHIATNRMILTRIPSAFMRVIRAGNPSNSASRSEVSCRSM